MARKTNYLNNKDLLIEIHKSKLSFCDYDDEKYGDYDITLDSKNDIFILESIKQARINRAKRLSKIAHGKAVENYMGDPKNKPKAPQYTIDPESIPYEDLIFRVMTYEHIPLAMGRKKNPKITADYHERINFKPFKHYKLVFNNDEEIENMNFDIEEVLVSHYKNGKYCPECGQITDKLAKMYMLLVDRYSKRANWNNYTYLDEMCGNSLLTLSAMGLRFDESKSNNPFGYFSKILEHAFTKVFNAEKKQQTIRDDLLESSGQNPSFTRQLENEEEIRLHREEYDNLD